MTKLEALKTCVWLECFAIDHSHGMEFYEAIRKISELQKYIGKLPDDELELQIEVIL